MSAAPAPGSLGSGGAEPGGSAAAEAGMPPAPVALSLPAGTTPEEVAALVAVLLASGPGPDAAGPGSVSPWADHARAARGQHVHGSGAWRASALPR